MAHYHVHATAAESLFIIEEPKKVNAVNYRNLKLKDLKKKEYRHLLLILYWPIFIIAFLLIERLPGRTYAPIHCFVDDLIPFCEYFVIFYLMWFVFWIGMLAYALFYEPDVFTKLMRYLILTFSVTLLIYAVFPNCQNMRPTEFAGDNIFISIVRFIYWIDTSTNVCPSMHVIAAVGVVFAAFHSKRFCSPGRRAAFIISAFLICISTMFIKQHSFIDHAVALPICAVGYYICFRPEIFRRHADSAGKNSN